MPHQKNFKRLVRGRMAKTGESYTTARSQFTPATAATVPPIADPDSAALARALAAAGYVNPADGGVFSEGLLFGVAGGIGFAYLVFVYPGWTSVNLDGRFNALYFEKKGFIETACARLGARLRVRPTSDAQVTERYLRRALEAVPEVALTVDLACLPGRASSRGPSSPWPVTVSAQDADLTVAGLPRGRVTMGWPELVGARWANAKKYGGLYQLSPPGEPLDVRAAVLGAIGRTAQCMLEPGRSNFDGSFGVPGIRKWARLLTDPRDAKGWPKLFAEPDGLRDALASVVDGLGGAGGRSGATRRRYAAFLDEAASLLGEPALSTAARTYSDLGERWTMLVALASEPGCDPADLAAVLPDLADAEEAAALSLRAAVTSYAKGD
ncbi:MAG TPA: DUF4872 domain-containing protein [Streptosporangiaceae bacterium]|nr:DUF4872 domain-containing protein [Streptosporangiaceae bacterium]